MFLQRGCQYDQRKQLYDDLKKDPQPSIRQLQLDQQAKDLEEAKVKNYACIASLYDQSFIEASLADQDFTANQFPKREKRLKNLETRFSELFQTLLQDDQLNNEKKAEYLADIMNRYRPEMVIPVPNEELKPEVKIILAKQYLQLLWLAKYEGNRTISIYQALKRTERSCSI